MDTKQCSKCKEVQPIANFTLYGSGKLAGKYRSWCRKCSSAQVADWSRRNREYLREKQRRYYAENYHLSIRAHMRRYGKDEKWYLDQYEKQKGLCAICGKPEKTKRTDGKPWRLAADHNHVTGAIRGLLCVSCNNRLATLEAHEWLPKAMAYLKQYE